MGRQDGLVLVELMIVMVINLFMLTILFSLYSASMRGMESQSALIDTQMNASTAMSLLRGEIHQAGYIGCAKLVKNFPVIPYHDYVISPGTKLMGGLSKDLSVRYMEHPGNSLLDDVNPNQLIVTTNIIHYKPDDILMISDCYKAEIFKVGNIRQMNGKQFISPASPLRSRFNQYAEVGRLMVNRYYIDKKDKVNRLGQPIYALFVEDIQHRKYELVEGVKNMDLIYTLRVNGSLLNESAKNITNWEDVEAVSIDLSFDRSGLPTSVWLYAKILGYSS